MPTGQWPPAGTPTQTPDAHDKWPIDKILSMVCGLIFIPFFFSSPGICSSFYSTRPSHCSHICVLRANTSKLWDGQDSLETLTNFVLTSLIFMLGFLNVIEKALSAFGIKLCSYNSDNQTIYTQFDWNFDIVL